MYRTSTIVTKSFWMLKRCTKCLSTSHMFSGYKSTRLLSSNSFPGSQFTCTEDLTSTHSFSGCQNEWLPPDMVKTHVPNVYHPHPVFHDVKTHVPNVYHPHLAFADVETHDPNVYQPQTAFPDVKTSVPNVDHPHTAFSDVEMQTLNIYHSHTASKLVYRMPNIFNRHFSSGNVCTKRLT